MRDDFVCDVCGNKDKKYIGYRNGRPYCRKCILFKGEPVKVTTRYPKLASIVLNYELSKDQKRLSDRILNNYLEGINTLVHAVCGSGKTEIVLAAISCAIRSGERVAFAIPRRDVVIEIRDRLKQIFKWNKIVAVYGGNTDKLEGDIVCLTTHQLYRYEKYFDLIVLDELDAFPYHGSEVLEAFFLRACRRNYVMLSATPDDKVIQQFSKPGFDVVNLNTRYHGHKLPVPEVEFGIEAILFTKLIKYLRLFLKEKKQVFIFVPIIEKSEALYQLVNPLIKGGSFVHSKCHDREKKISEFKNGKTRFLFTTAVLERGVTVRGLQVIVFGADHSLYDSHALIQIAGRAGRKKDAPEGRVIFLATKNTDEITRTINEIVSANKDLQNMF